MEVATKFMEMYELQEIPLFVDDPDARSVRRSMMTAQLTHTSEAEGTIKVAAVPTAIDAKSSEEAVEVGPLEEFEFHFAPWPLRFYVLLGDQVVS